MTIAATPKVEMALGRGPFDYTSEVDFTGSGNTYVTAPHQTKFDAIVNGFDVRVCVKLASWSSPTVWLASNGGSATAPHVTWQVGFNAGNPTLAFNGGGTLRTGIDSTYKTNFAANTRMWFRFVAVPASSSNMTFTTYASVNGLIWTLMSSVQLPVTNTVITTTLANAVYVGCGFSSTNTIANALPSGSVVYAFELWASQPQVRTLRLDPDEAWNATDTSWTSVSGDVWTVGTGASYVSSWVDVTAYVRHEDGIDTEFGRSSNLDRFQTGSAAFTLKNDDRRFDPDYAAGPYFGKLTIRHPVRVRAQYNSVNYPLHRGINTSGWPNPADPSNKVASVAIESADAFAIFTGATAIQSVFDQVVIDDNAAWGNVADGWWRFDGQNTVKDLTTNGHDLNMFSGLTLSTSPPIVGAQGGRVTFDGDTYATQAITGISYPIVVEMVVQCPADELPVFGAPLFFLTANGSTVLQCALEPFGAGTYLAAITAGGGGAGQTPQVVNGIPIEQNYVMDGNPHHVVFQIDTPTATPGMHIYVDGVSIPVTVGTGTDNSSSADRVSVGLNPALWGAADSMVIDEVVLYAGAPSANTDANFAATVALHGVAALQGRLAETAGGRIPFVLDSVGFRGDMVDMDAGLVTLQPYSSESTDPLDYIQAIEQTEQGEFFMDARGFATFRQRDFGWNRGRSTGVQYILSDDGSDTAYLADGFALANDDKLLFNQSQVSRDGGPTILVQDATSIANYGAKEADAEGLLMQTDVEAQDVGQGIVYFHKDLISRIDSVVVYPQNVPATIYPQMLGTQVADLITVQRTPQAVGTQISKNALVEGIKHHLDTVEWKTTLALNTQTPAKSAAFFVWGTGKWGDVSVWGF